MSYRPFGRRGSEGHDTTRSEIGPRIRHIPADNPVTRMRYRLAESNAVILNINDTIVRFSSLFLRDSCQCSQCVDIHSGQKRFATSEIPLDIAARNVHVETGDKLIGNRVRIEWESEKGSTTEPHVSWYEAKWLESAASVPVGNELSSTAHRNIYLWNEHRFKRDIINYARWQEPKGFKKAIYKLTDSGIIFLRDVPAEETAVEAVAESIGPIKNTFYGRTWDVKDKPMAENVAYTNVFLDLHMDLLYMKYPPGFQLLHCIRASDEGGKSIFADAFYAAEVLYKSSPKDFEALCTFPVTYRYNKNGNFYTDTKVTIELDTTKPPDPISGMPAIANVNWAPPFQGPFVVDRGSSDYAREITAYHRAAKAFQAIISAPENQFTHMLQPGQCVIFNNRRILHGREQFNSFGVKEGEERWLKGAYLDMDDVSSTLRRVSGEGWVYAQMKKNWADEKKPQQLNASTNTREVTQYVATQGTTSKIPNIKELSPELENMLEKWFQRRAQKDVQELQEPPTTQVPQETQLDHDDQDNEELDEELALHEHRAEQRLHDATEADSTAPPQKSISHAFAEARGLEQADEEDSDWKVMDEVAKPTDSEETHEQLDIESSDLGNGGRLAASEAPFISESQTPQYGRY